MIDIFSQMFCFVTASVSFLYATRICWMCGRSCSFVISPSERRDILKAKMPAGFAIYAFGFFILFSCRFDGGILITTLSLTSALILSHFVVSMAMPILKRRPNPHEL